MSSLGSLLSRMRRLRPLAARLRAAGLEVDERLGEEWEAQAAARTTAAYAALHGTLVPLTGEGVLHVLECLEDPPGPGQLGMSPSTLEATAAAVARLAAQSRGAVVLASVELVSIILRTAPHIWWSRQGRAEHEPYRVRPGEEWMSLAAVRARLRADDVAGAFRALPVAAGILVERAARERATLLGIGPQLHDLMAEVDAVRTIGIQLSGRVPAGPRYDTWAATIDGLDAALAVIEAGRTGET